MTDIPSIVSATAAPTTGISVDSSRVTSKANLKEAGDKFESVFTGMMLGAMRKASLADTLFESKALDTFRDMQDQRIAESMATHSPIGIGKAMTEFLGRSQPDLNASPPNKAE